jgi:hypothetical protein
MTAKWQKRAPQSMAYMDDTPKAKRTLMLSPSSWSNLYPNQPQPNSFSQMSKVFCSPLLLHPLLFHKKLCHGDAALHTQTVFTKHHLEQWHSYSCKMTAGKQDARTDYDLKLNTLFISPYTL